MKMQFQLTQEEANAALTAYVAKQQRSRNVKVTGFNVDTIARTNEDGTTTTENALSVSAEVSAREPQKRAAKGEGKAKKPRAVKSAE